MNCNFCKNFFRLNKEQNLPEKESILYEDENIYVMPDISPLEIGHVLIVSKRHYQGFASADKKTIQSLKNFLGYYKRKISNRNFTVFEHGAVIKNSAGASIDHAHMHILPFEFNLRDRIARDYGKPEAIHIDDLEELGKAMQPYFYCMDSNITEGYIFKVGTVPSQILRKMVNELLNNMINYNWKQQYQNLDAKIMFYKTIYWWKSLGLKSPFKWRKKLLLEKYEFTDYRTLVGEINRFEYDDQNVVEVLLDKELQNSNRESDIYRIVLVSKKHHYFLPNYIIAKKDDIAGIKKFCSDNPNFEEIWYVKNRALTEGNYSGRISVFKQGMFTEYIVELTLGDNLRNLEHYSLGKNNIKYLRAKKGINDVVLKIEENTMNNASEDILHSFEYVKKEISNYNENILLLAESLYQYGIRAISLDFRIEGNKLVFIDWDTSNDELVLRNEIN